MKSKKGISNLEKMILYSINFVILLLLAILLIVVFILKLLRYDRLKHKASRRYQDDNDQDAQIY